MMFVDSLGSSKSVSTGTTTGPCAAFGFCGWKSSLIMPGTVSLWNWNRKEHYSLRFAILYSVFSEQGILF
jgi:hypothetical protein